MKALGGTWALVTALAALGAPGIAAAEGEDDAEDETEDSGVGQDEDEADDVEADRPDPERRKRRAARRAARDNGNAFEATRFFIDKVDTDATLDGTLVQGHLTASSFYYGEGGGLLPGADGAAGVTAESPYARMFTDLRAQVEAKHLRGGRWDLRLDTRGRLASNPSDNTDLVGDTRVQAGALGRSELDLRELSMTRVGERVDVVFGRQYASELAVKLDGLRVDYARTSKWSAIVLAGLYPARGSRSIGTDYAVGRDETGMTVGRVLPVVGGAGVGYRTAGAYGAVGVVGIVPLKAEGPRIYATSNGYARLGPRADIYHLGVIDVVSDAGAALTNLSLGANLRPNQRLRFGLAAHHVDTETLGLTAQAFLADPGLVGVVRNDTEIRRIASQQARATFSAALGRRFQMEVSSFAALRRRPAIDVEDGLGTTQTIAAAQGYEVGLAATHRNLLRGVRVTIDLSRSAGVGSVTYARNQSWLVHVGASREFRGGRGEWQADVSYLSGRDDTGGTVCTNVDISQCFGASSLKVIEAQGGLVYRLRDNILLFGHLSMGRQAGSSSRSGMLIADPNILMTSVFARAAYRF